MDAVHSVRVHVVGEAACAADAGDEDDALRRQPELGHEALRPRSGSRSRRSRGTTAAPGRTPRPSFDARQPSVRASARSPARARPTVNGSPCDLRVRLGGNEEVGPDELEPAGPCSARARASVGYAASTSPRFAGKRVEVEEMRRRDAAAPRAHAAHGRLDRARRSSPSRARAARRRRGRRPRAAGCHAAIPAHLPGAQAASSARGLPDRRRCCRCRPPSRGRRSGARAPACREPPTAARGSRHGDREGSSSGGSARSRSPGRSRGGRPTSGISHGSDEFAEERVREEDHRRPVGHGDTARLDRGVEALGRRVRRDDRDRRLAVAAVHAPSAGRPPRSSSASRSRGRHAGRRRSPSEARASPRARSSRTSDPSRDRSSP